MYYYIKGKNMNKLKELYIKYKDIILSYIKKEKQITSSTLYFVVIELQIVLNNNSVLLSDLKLEAHSKDGLLKLATQHLEMAYKVGTLRILDKSNKYYTFVSTNDIKKVLFKMDNIKEVTV
jgi:hypothetical protein